MSDLKTIRQQCKDYAKTHLKECSAELIEWQDTAILRDGRVRELAAMCNEFISNHDGLRMAESFINRAAVESMATPPAQSSGQSLEAAILALPCVHEANMVQPPLEGRDLGMWQNGFKFARRAAAALASQPPAPQASAQPAADVCAEMRALCSACGGTGDVHGIDGEWRGACNCEASAWSRQPAAVVIPDQSAFLRLVRMSRKATRSSGDTMGHDDYFTFSATSLFEFVSSIPSALAATMPSAAPSGWISVDERLPEVDQLALVYVPSKAGEPDDIRFDCIDPNDDDHASWLAHNEHYEHFCCVAKPEDSIGPSEKAPYTHWMPLPAAPASPQGADT